MIRIAVCDDENVIVKQIEHIISEVCKRESIPVNIDVFYVSEAQACIGRDTKNGSVFRRVGNAVKIFSIMVTWSLENAIETADSMRSRGYGLPGRTAFSIYRFDDRDKAALAWLIFCGAYLLSGWMAGGTYFRYYPTVKNAAWTPMTVSFMCVYLALVLTPVILDRKEDRQWNSLQSTI